MNKEDILKKLNDEEIDKDKTIINLESALVLRNLMDICDDITISCDNDYFEELDYYSPDLFNKKKDNIVFTKDYYDSSYDIIENYKVASEESIYNILKSLKDKKYKKILNKLDLYLCSIDNYRYERDLRKKGITFIAGVDEVGRGPLVGPVVAACCVLPEHFELDGLTDSKKLSEEKRNFFDKEIRRQALGYGIGVVDEKKIDEVNIYEATKIAMKKAIEECKKMCKIEHVLIDAMPLDIDVQTTSIIKGDIKSITISAASVLAKVYRDNMMYELDKKYPMYDFKKNKGYPTKEHLEAIEKYGIIDEHRKSYGPVKDYLDKNAK